MLKKNLGTYIQQVVTTKNLHNNKTFAFTGFVRILTAQLKEHKIDFGFCQIKSLLISVNNTVHWL